MLKNQKKPQKLLVRQSGFNDIPMMVALSTRIYNEHALSAEMVRGQI